VSAHAYAQEPPDWLAEDGPTFEESLRADEATLTHRGFSSDFCGAWLSLWQTVAQDYGAQIENFLKEPAAPLIESARMSYMALIHAMARDTSGSQTRRVQIGAGFLWAYRSGAVIPPKPAEGAPDFIARTAERKRVLSNYGRYWRGAEGWRPVFRLQKATHLAFFVRDSRTFKDNTRTPEAAWYTDNLTDLLGDIIRRKRSFRGRGLSRAEKFTRAAGDALDAFRRNVPPFAPEAQPRDADETDPTPDADPKPPKVVIDFGRAKKNLLAGVEIACARAEAGRMTPEQADELITLLAPVVSIARALLDSSTDVSADGVTSEDLSTPDPESSRPRASGGIVDFSAENEESAEATADKFIRTPPPVEMALDAFLAAFRPTEAEPLHLRTFCPKGAPKNDPRFAARLIPASRTALRPGGGLLAQLRKINQTCGLYFTVNQGGDRDEEINRITAFFAEADEGTLAEQHANLDACPLPPSVRVETRKSVHAYWLAVPGCSIEEWRTVQRRLIHYFKADPKIKNPSRVMRLPDFNHVSYTDGLLSFKPVMVAAFDASRRYAAADLLAVFPAVPEPPKPRFDFRPSRASDSFEEFKRELGARVASHESARRNGSGKIDCRAVCHDGKGSTGLFYDPTDNGVICNRGCDLPTIARAFGMEMPAPGAPHVQNGRERGTI
jgi:hypothetical protein